MQKHESVSQLVEHLFRHESAKMVATLTRIFGIEHLNLAEDVVQEALGRALQTWPYRGIPENPSAWIMRASRNLALDVIRREKVFRGKEAEISRLIEAGGSSTHEAVIFSEKPTTPAVDDPLASISRAISASFPRKTFSRRITSSARFRDARMIHAEGFSGMPRYGHVCNARPNAS